MGRWMHVLRLRVRALLRTDVLDRDLDRELRSHLDQQIDEYVASGMAPGEARQAALREFGSVAGVQEACRDTRRVTPVHNIARDLRYAGRTLLAHPLLLLAASSSIALGVGANLTIFSLANNLLLAPPTAFRADRLVHIRTGNGSHVSYPGWRGLHESGALAGVAGYNLEESVNWRSGGDSVTVVPLIVTANFFDVVGVPMQRGRGFAAGEAMAARDPRLVVLSDGFWRRQLGADPDVIGRPLIFNGHPYTVVGVLARDIRSLPGYGLAPDVYLPIGPALVPDLENPRAAAVQLIGRLHEGQSVEAGRAAVTAAVQRLAERTDDRELRVIATFAPVGGVSQAKDFPEIGAFFLALMVMTGLVLAIACANVAGLLLARGTARRRELAMRVALGASRPRLVQQLLTEGFVLALFGTAAGMAVTALVSQFVTRVSLPLPLPLQLRVTFDYRLVALALALVLISTVLCALMPALNTTRGILVPSMKQDEPSLRHRRFSLRALLVIGQVAITVLLLVSSVVFLRNLIAAQTLDLGFEPDALAVARLTFVEGRQGSRAAPAVERIVERIQALPGVEAAAFTDGVPLTIFSGASVGTTMQVTGAEGPVHAEYEANRVGPGYFAAMAIPLLRGRDFVRADRAAAPGVAIVNEAFVERYLGGRDPIGAHLRWPERDGSPGVAIVGVVANGKYRFVSESRNAAIYTPYLQAPERIPAPPVDRFVHIVARTSVPPAAVAGAMREAVLETDPDIAVAVEPMASALAFAFLPSRIGAVLFGAMGVLACLLAMVGLYGVISFAVSRRKVEIGIRMALGASRGAVLRMVLKESAVLVMAGVVIGLALAVLLADPLGAFVVAGLRPADPLHLAGTAAFIVAVSLIAAWSPARRAVRIQPATALRLD